MYQVQQFVQEKVGDVQYLIHRLKIVVRLYKVILTQGYAEEETCEAVYCSQRRHFNKFYIPGCILGSFNAKMWCFNGHIALRNFIANHESHTTHNRFQTFRKISSFL